MRDVDMIDDFIEECEEAIELAENELLSFAKDGSTESLAVVFRNLHTIKGSAQAMELNELAKLVHGMETALEPLRNSNSVDQSLVDQTLSNIDRIRAFNQSLKEDPMAEMAA